MRGRIKVFKLITRVFCLGSIQKRRAIPLLTLHCHSFLFLYSFVEWLDNNLILHLVRNDWCKWLDKSDPASF